MQQPCFRASNSHSSLLGEDCWTGSLCSGRGKEVAVGRRDKALGYNKEVCKRGYDTGGKPGPLSCRSLRGVGVKASELRSGDEIKN